MEQVEDTWSIPANLRWLAEQNDRPGYVPCGELTGRFLNLTADRFEALATRTNDQAKDEEIAKLVEALETLVGETLGGDLSREDEKAVTPRGSYSTWISWSDRWEARDLIAKHKAPSNG